MIVLTQLEAQMSRPD